MEPVANRAIFFRMAKDRKTPQEKKRLEYTKDHFTFGQQSSRMFPRTWKRKKARANRKYRRKSEQILAQAKPGTASQDLPLTADDLTVARFTKSVVRKPLRKTGTVTLEEKVKLTLARREKTVGRRSKIRAFAHQEATSVIQTLSSLRDDNLEDFVRRANLLCTSGDPNEWARVRLSKEPIDQALYFLYRLDSGRNSPRETVCRDEQLRKPLADWFAKANRILSRDARKIKRKLEQKQTTEKRLKALRRAAPRAL